MPKKTPKLMTEDFKIEPNTYLILERNGIPRTYAGTLIKDFIDYWIVNQTKRASWQLTFIKRAKSQWEYARHDRFRDYEHYNDDKPTNDKFFTNALDAVTKQLTKAERIEIMNKYMGELK